MTLRVRHLVIAAVTSAAVPVFTLYLAFVNAPTYVPIEDIDTVTSIAVSKPVQDHISRRDSVLFIKGMSAIARLEELQKKYPAIGLRSWNERPGDPGCGASTGTYIVGPCSRDDFVAVGEIEFPLWRTAQIHIGVFNGGCRMLLVKVGNRWRVLSEEWIYI